MSDEPRTTGPRSQNHILHGWCQDLADQFDVPKALVYQVIVLEAVEEGVVELRDVLGTMVAEHESRWTMRQAADVTELIPKRAAMLAAQYDRPVYLHEYDETGKRVRKVWYSP